MSIRSGTSLSPAITLFILRFSHRVLGSCVAGPQTSCRRSPNYLLQVPKLAVASPRLVRHRSQPRVSPVRISSADLRRFSATRAFYRRRSRGKVRTCDTFRPPAHSTVAGPKEKLRPATQPPLTGDGEHWHLRRISQRPATNRPPTRYKSVNDLRRFSVIRAFCRRWSLGKVRTCNATAADR